MSEFDYYQVLQLNRTATIDDIKKAFRRLSLKYHPTKNPSDITVCSDQFHQICEAYEVLSDSKSRTVYDKFGTEILSRGLHGITEASYSGYKYKRNAFSIFEKFYQEYLLDYEILGFTVFDNKNFDDAGKWLRGSAFGDPYGGTLVNNREIFEPTDVHVHLECTLDELYIGCMKEINYDRYITQLDKQIVPSSETKMIEIKPGFKDGHEIVLKEEGSQSLDGVCKDLIVHIKQLPHTHYSRQGDDLLYKHDMPLVDALNSAPCKFKTLDGRTLSISVDEIISPQTVRIVEDEGMPIYDAEEESMNVIWSKRGKLFIVFNIQFPHNLTEDKKKRIVQVLNSESIINEE